MKKDKSLLYEDDGLMIDAILRFPKINRNRTDIYEKDSKRFVVFEVPGLIEDSLKITSNNGIVNIEADIEMMPEESKVLLNEIQEDSFARSVMTPIVYDNNHYQVAYKNGIVTVCFDKKT